MNIQMLRTGMAALALVMLSACDSDGTDPGLPVVSIPDITFAPSTITGVAATGAAIDGATVEVIDSSGSLVDTGDVLTGANGAYQVTLPPGVTPPVIIRVTPPGGPPLLTVVPPPPVGTIEIVANVNPITSLVSSSVLDGASPADNAALAGALATIDPATVAASGDAVVQRLLGNSVGYDTFASDPDFAAQVEGGASPSAADAILDTLARQADAAGIPLAQSLANLNSQADPPLLLDEPEFQVVLVSEMIEGGTPAANIESALSAIGALAPVVTGAPDVFRTVIATVPSVITTVRDGLTTLSTDAALAAIAVQAAVDLLASTINEKQERFGASPATLVAALGSPSLGQTVNSVVQSSVVPMLNNFVGSGGTATIAANLKQVTTQITQQAAVITSTFQFTATSTDVSNLVGGFVAQQVTAPTTPEALAAAATGSAPAIVQVGDVNAVRGSIEAFAAENADLVEGDLADLVEEVPPGVWGTSKWGGFNWG